MSSTVRALALAIFLALLAAAPASAGQIVYNTDSAIHVVNDNGSGDRELIKVSDVRGATSVIDPWVDPNGTTVVFAARTPYSAASCGFGCVGVYRWDAGKITRISLHPVSCSGCTGLDLGPRITRDSQNVFFEHIDTQSGNTHIGTTWYEAPAVADGAGSEVDQKDNGKCGSPTNFVPSPAADEVAFVDCYTDTSEYSIKVKNSQGQIDAIARDDDYNISGIAWRPDGSQLIDTENGNDPGLWLYPRVPNGNATELVPLNYGTGPSQSDIATTWVGSDEIAFTYNGQIRTVPTSCDMCSVDSAGVVLNAPNVTRLAWTAQTLPVVQPSTGTTQQGGSTGTTSGTPASTSTSATTPSAGTQGNTTGGGKLALAAAKAKLAAALKGLTLPFTAPSAGKLAITAKLDAKTARKLKLIKKGKKPVTVASGSASPTAAGKSSVKLKFTKAAAKRLKKAKSLKLALVGTFKPAAGGAGQSLKSSVTLKR